MSTAARPQWAPQCLSCLGRSLKPGTTAMSNPFRMQVRHKSKYAKMKGPATVHARMLLDVDKMGPKDAVVNVAAAWMRNELYPKQIAVYVTEQDVKNNRRIKPSALQRGYKTPATLALERRARSAEERAAESTQRYAQAPAQVSLLSAARSRELLDELVPATLEFERETIAAPRTNNISLQDTTPAGPTAIHGSVSPESIALLVRYVLTSKASETGYADASRVVVNPEDIRITGSKTEGALVEEGKVKVLGDFEVEIAVKGHMPLRRLLKVMALEQE